MTADPLAVPRYRLARYAAARADLHAAVRDAVAAGMSESEAARVAGVARDTVRRILGKG